MGLFSKILNSLGFGSKAHAEEAIPSGTPTTAPPAPAGTGQVDVVGKLEGLAARHPEKLNWKASIVDLLKLLDLDSSLQARKELASELGCPPEKMGDSAQMNMWLHKTVLQKLAENGGNVPPELLH
ncbi:DUF3597 domain-containing protein [Azotobacter salinestris]|uniref:DUF3597 domain-containing protein n=1 Tax=Azotobacter salinestris TaxID=69964 RepID=UPI00126698EB|nr:DUF3597 domain-containing protein [Azotobacter salinestris]